MAADVDTIEHELSKFREEWKAEVRQKRHPKDSLSSTSTAAAVTTPAASSATPHVATRGDQKGRHSGRERSIDGAAHVVGAPGPMASPTSTASSALAALNQTQQSAVNSYRRAVEEEQQGHLDEALRLYRQSFRMDSDVDKVYHRLQMLEITAGAQALDIGSGTISTHKGKEGPRPKSSGHAHAESLSAKVPHMTLAALLASFDTADVFEFAPEDEQIGTPFSQTPDEIIILILREFARVRDITSLERFGSINKKARLVSLDRSLWRCVLKLLTVTYSLDSNDAIEIPFILHIFLHKLTSINHLTKWLLNMGRITAGFLWNIRVSVQTVFISLSVTVCSPVLMLCHQYY